jgi:A/G-specific adenine glycosylase
MELGAVICTPRRPNCPLCPVRNHCAAFREKRTDQLPNLGKPIASTKRRFAAFLVERNHRFLVRRRPPGVVNARLWEFPNVEVAGRRTDERQLAESLLGSRPVAIRPLHRVRHTITRYRITLDVFRAEFADGLPGAIPQGRWCLPAELDKLPFPSAHRKIVKLLQARREFRMTNDESNPNPRNPNRQKSLG